MPARRTVPPLDGVAVHPADRPALPSRLRLARSGRTPGLPVRRRHRRAAHVQLGPAVHARRRVRARGEAVLARQARAVPRAARVASPPAGRNRAGRSRARSQSSRAKNRCRASSTAAGPLDRFPPRKATPRLPRRSSPRAPPEIPGRNPFRISNRLRDRPATGWRRDPPPTPWQRAMSRVSTRRLLQAAAADRAHKSISPAPAATGSNRRPRAPPRKTARADAKTKRACSLLSAFCRQRWRAENQL